MANAAVSVSFEFFPPADDAAAGHLWGAIQRLAPLRPRFVSVTYGADGRPGQNARVRHANSARHRSDRGSSSDVVGAPREAVLGIPRTTGVRACGTSWHYGGTRRRDCATVRTPADSPTGPISFGA